MDQKLSALAAVATPLTGADIMYVVRGGVAGRATANDVAKYSQLVINPAWYGLVEGDDIAHAAANAAVIAAILADLDNAGKFRIQFPKGTYWIGDNGAGAGIDINQGNLIIEGATGGGLLTTASALKFPAGVTGIRVQGSQTSGANTKDGVAHSSAAGSAIRNLTLIGSFAATEAEAHGIQLRTKTTIEDVTITGFEGDGIYPSASAGAASGATPPYGNVNSSRIQRVSITSCRNGIFADGTDANAMLVSQVNINGCRQWAIFDSSFLGNTYDGGLTAGCGTTAWNDGVTGPASIVSSGGNLYGCITGQEVGASTNAPTGAATDNTWWYYISAGAPTPGKPAWFNGMLVRAGGCAHTDSFTATNVFNGVYAEGDQGKAQLCEPSLVVGGILATWLYQNPVSPFACPVVRGGLDPTNNGSGVHIEPMLRVNSGAVTASLGAYGSNASLTALEMRHATYAASGYQLQFATAGSVGDIRFTRNNGTASAFIVTTTATAQQFGTGAAVSDAFSPPLLMVQDNAKSIGGARRLMIDPAIPTTGAHGQGEVVLRRTSTLTDPFASRCTTAGTPGTWQDIYSGLGTNPIGYVTGAGGTVAQATSKATGVTLNKLCGQVTMNAAALAAGAKVSFVLTNNQIAAGDIAIVNVISGGTANAYRAAVTASAAGSCTITVENITAGSLSEAPVIGFAVIKAVTA